MEISSRDDFSVVFKSLGYKTGVEVGVLDGDFSVELEKFGGKLYLVDAWRHIGGLDDVNNPEDQEHEARYQRVKSRFCDNPKIEIRRGLSIEMSKTFADGELDWVYLDADHREEAVIEDIKAWYSKIRIGGMICGHDYFDSPGWEGHRGVKAAVDGFFKDDKVFLTKEFQYEHSWYVLKRHNK